MINVVVPMAGEGSRFKVAGYENPKPMIDVAGKSMIERVLDNFLTIDAKFILIARQEHQRKYERFFESLSLNYNCSLVYVEGTTEGTACSILHAREIINTSTPMIVANSDQLVDVDISHFVSDCFRRGLSGSIMTFRDVDRNPKWSFAKVDAHDHVIEVQEKNPISDLATVGIYMFAAGKLFVDSAIDMIIRRDRVNGEYYTCPVYNYLIRKDKKIGIFNIEQTQMHGLGTPDDLAQYLNRI